jgi:hypothetical protein
LDGVRDGDRMGLAPLKKLDCLFTEAGDGGICAIVSIVRSDRDGRSSRRRPRGSCASLSSSSYTPNNLALSDVCAPSVSV